MGRLAAILLVLLSSVTLRVARAQNDPASRQAAIAAVYPVMLAALEVGNFGHARHLCDQVILWEPNNPVHYYNLACIEAGVGAHRLPEAFAALEQSIRLGFNDPDHLKNDPDLKALRADPRFEVLVHRTAANAAAGAVIQSIAIPDRLPPPVGLASMPPGGLPSGLFLVTPFERDDSDLSNCAAWYFSADGRVFQNPRRGVESTDVSAHRGRRGSVRLLASNLEITWNDGTKEDRPLQPRSNALAWGSSLLSPASPFARASDVVGSYLAAASLPDRGELAEVPRELELRSDNAATWITAGGITLHGRWELRGFTLRLIEADGSVLRLLAFPLETPKDSLKPERIFLGGAVFRRP